MELNLLNTRVIRKVPQTRDEIRSRDENSTPGGKKGGMKLVLTYIGAEGSSAPSLGFALPMP